MSAPPSPDFFAITPANSKAPGIVIAQLGQSLDGRIATSSGESRGISGPLALDHLHRLRAQADAVVVGVGTVEADDPALTVRRVRGSNPLRVVIDPSGRMSRQARCLQCAEVPTLVITACETRWPAAVEILRLPAPDRQIAPAAILAALRARGLSRILVEGGARTVSGFIDAGCIDRLHLMVSPVIIGSGRMGLELNAPATLGLALRPSVKMSDLGGGDILFECDLRSGTGGGDGTQESLVYKIAPRALWQRAKETGRFTGAPVDLADGFIHFSSAAQVAETAARHFAGQDDLLLVAVDVAMLGPALKWEVSRGGALFPHLYGDLPMAAVTSVALMLRGRDGHFDFAGLLP